MGIQIQERFQVEAPVERVWGFLIDPQSVVACLPGAEMTEQVDERTYQGNLKFKLGPLALNFPGRVQFTEIDKEAHRVQMLGEGREITGVGMGKLSMSSQLTSLPDGGTEVVVDVEIELVGKIVQFGRGLIEGVSRNMFKQFAQCLQERMKAEE